MFKRSSEEIQTTFFASFRFSCAAQKSRIEYHYLLIFLKKVKRCFTFLRFLGIQKMETRAQKKQRLIRLIHVAKTQLMMDDGEYRVLLANLSCGKTSSTKLSVEELELAVRAMKMRGFVITTKAQAASSEPDLPVHMPNRMMEAQVKKIRALWLELHHLGAVRSPSELSLARFVKRMTGIDYHGWLGTDDAIRVIEHLKKWKVRVENGGQQSA